MTFKPDPFAKQFIQCEDLYTDKDKANLANNIMESYVSEKELQKGIIMDMAHRVVLLPNGKTSLREIAYHSGAAAVVPVDNEGNVTLVYQHRCVIGKVTLEIPAGKMDSDDEDPKVCAIRELEEETGLKAENVELLLSMDTTPGFCTEFVAIYLATGLTQSKVHTDEDEFLGIIKIPIVEAIKRVKNGELTDGKTALGIMLAASKLGIDASRIV